MLPRKVVVRSLKVEATIAETPAPHRNAFHRIARGSGSRRSSQIKIGNVYERVATAKSIAIGVSQAR